MSAMAVGPGIGGVGESIKRKEDAKFLQGRGQYVDDLVLPGMLHMAILRSPYAHARIGASTPPRPRRCRGWWRWSPAS
jgi:carbon-monoxide dehydrogenase large subunit